MSTHKIIVPLDPEELSSDDLCSIINFAEGIGELPPKISPAAVTPRVISKAYKILDEFGLLSFRPDAHYDGASA